jgi:hypothetical protein
MILFLGDWQTGGGEPYGRKVDPGRFWQWAVKRMGYSIISLAQGDFFQKTRSTGVRRFSISRATSSQNSSRLSPSQLLGAPSLGTLSLSLGGVQMREVRAKEFGLLFWRCWHSIGGPNSMALAIDGLIDPCRHCSWTNCTNRTATRRLFQLPSNRDEAVSAEASAGAHKPWP